MGYITFSYRQHETQNFFILLLVWERGKMSLCNDWANHQNLSQNWPGWCIGRERVWSLKVRDDRYYEGYYPKSAWIKSAFFFFLFGFFLESIHIAFWFQRYWNIHILKSNSKFLLLRNLRITKNWMEREGRLS